MKKNKKLPVPPPKKTFYLAASSKSLGAVQRMAFDLQEAGFVWYGGWIWSDMMEIPAPHFLGAVHNDLASAVHADLFVLVLGPHPSFGAAAEFGARLTAGKEAHVVLNGQPDHPFLHHAKVTKWATWDDFMKPRDPYPVVRS